MEQNKLDKQEQTDKMDKQEQTKRERQVFMKAVQMVEEKMKVKMNVPKEWEQK